jgi:hypothetical protein
MIDPDIIDTSLILDPLGDELFFGMTEFSEQRD